MIANVYKDLLNPFTVDCVILTLNQVLEKCVLVKVLGGGFFKGKNPCVFNFVDLEEVKALRVESMVR